MFGLCDVFCCDSFRSLLGNLEVPLGFSTITTIHTPTWSSAPSIGVAEIQQILPDCASSSSSLPLLPPILSTFKPSRLFPAFGMNPILAVTGAPLSKLSFNPARVLDGAATCDRNRVCMMSPIFLSAGETKTILREGAALMRR